MVRVFYFAIFCHSSIIYLVSFTNRYKDPVPLFQDKNNPLFEYDMLFQDDGARSLRFAPYAANTGFFFARHNERTRYFFISMLYHADMIQRTRSHQAVVASLLPEFNSLVGLKVKTLQDTDFPGGFHYLRKFLIHFLFVVD